MGRTCATVVRHAIPEWANINVTSISTSRTAANGYRMYVIFVRGAGSRVCLNRRNTPHNSDGAIFFELTATGLVQRCAGGCGREYRSSCLAYNDEFDQVLFPSLASALAREGGTQVLGKRTHARIIVPVEYTAGLMRALPPVLPPVPALSRPTHNKRPLKPVDE